MKGEVVAAPAEGVYGYCCDAFNEPALTKLLNIKNRPAGKGLIVLISNMAQLKRLVEETGYEADIKAAIYQNWPGNTTLILPAKESLPYLLTGGKGTVAVRFPSCPHMQEYLKAWGRPLVSTSLNETGEPPVRRAQDIPPGPFNLKLPQDLSGTPSRIFNVITGIWER